MSTASRTWAVVGACAVLGAGAVAFPSLQVEAAPADLGGAVRLPAASASPTPEAGDSVPPALATSSSPSARPSATGGDDDDRASTPAPVVSPAPPAPSAVRAPGDRSARPVAPAPVATYDSADSPDDSPAHSADSPDD
jgi:hypothetical protein